MGKRWSRKRKKAENKRKQAQSNNKPRKESWAFVIPGNPKMEAYYALEGLHNQRWDGGELVECTTDQQKEEERMKWLTSLRSMLPASFRIGTDVDPLVRERLELELDSHFVDTEMEIVVEEDKQDDTTIEDKKESSTKKIAPAKHIPYIPHAYQLSVDRKTIRRNPALQEFHEWLQAQTLCGHITRQETVSMIPPVVLSVEPHHKVLDMCAAPGSKTSQLLEIVSTFDGNNDLEPKGCVVANDSDPKRAYMLVHQLRRINSPAVLVTSCDAQFFPLLDGEGMFDRVLCDVPCSGDGTTRKNPGVWRHWSAIGALSLHPVQLGIALNGARLTKVGGYLCYSTCSMNPIENEAVVAELLRAADGSLELVDKRGDMPGLVARPGRASWRVFRENKSRKQMKDAHRKKNNAKMQARRREWEEKNKHGGEENSVDEKNDDEVDAANGNAEEADDDEAMDPNKDHSGGPPPSWDEETLLARLAAEGVTEFKSFDEVPDEWKRSVRKTCFPPTEEEAAKFGLEKCLRCLPHDMDTGGFFVALLKKVKPMSARAKREAMELAEEFRPEAVGTDGNGELPPDTKRAKTENTTSVEANGPDTSDNEMEVDSQVDDSNDGEKKLSSDTKAPKDKSPFRGKRRGNLGNDYFAPLKDGIWEELDEFYGFASSFPKEQFMARANGDAKTLFFLSESIKDMIDRGVQERLTVINSGLKAFSKNNKDCKVLYRVAQEGIHYVAPHMTKRKIVADLADFSKCIAVDQSMRLELFSEDFASAVRELEPGSFVVALKGYENDASKKLFIVMWRCRKDAVDCLVAKIEQEGMMSKLRAIPGYECAEAAAKAAISG